MSRVRFALLLTVIVVTAADGARLTVCTFSFNRPDEVAVFKAELPKEDFDVVDLTPRPPLPSASGTAPAASLASACSPRLHCDVVVYSAEFAGRFFGSSGTSVSVGEMEEASCERSCRGLFHHPSEVFLLGCNTLATKDQDRRTPDEYLQVLLDHGFDRASAERVVALRYGPLGPSFRGAHRRIFKGVPRLYGFSSVAPTADFTVTRLRRYFRAKGNYRQYLEETRGDARPNRELLDAFRGTGLVQTSGLTPSEAAAADRAQICRLYDETRPVDERLAVIAGFFERGDFFAFLPTVETFMARHPAEQLNGEARRVLAEIRDRHAARDQVVALVRDLDVSALKMELAHLALQLRWMTAKEFRTLAIAGARQLLRRPVTSEVVDVMCEISKRQFLGDALRSDDLPDPLFRDAEGLRLVDCVSPVDRAITARLATGLDSSDPSVRGWAAYALSRRLPLPDAILLRLAGHLADPSPEVRERVRWIFRADRAVSDDVRRAVATADPQFVAELRTAAR